MTIVSKPVFQPFQVASADWQKLDKATTILSTVKEKLKILTDEEEDQTLEEFLNGLKIDKEVYKWALQISEKGTTIILKRNLKERFVNNYNPKFILAWQANMDLQFCIDTYAIVTYVTDYLTKSDQG